ncbi:TPA: PolC-type DNA polymerase III [Streptococcus suis]
MVQAIAVLDLETTGPNYEVGDRIIQLGLVIIEKGAIRRTHTQLINPLTEIPSHISQITGIRQDMVNTAPSFDQVAETWFDLLNNKVFVAHNLLFDLPFITKAFAAVGLEFAPQIALDSVVLAKILLPQANNFNLSDLALHFNLKEEKVHDALGDALITAQILQGLAKRFDGFSKEHQTFIKQHAKHLSHQEAYFFDHYLDFLNPSGPSFVEQMSKAIPEMTRDNHLEDCDLDSELLQGRGRYLLQTAYPIKTLYQMISAYQDRGQTFILIQKDDEDDTWQGRNLMRLHRQQDFVNDRQIWALLSDTEKLALTPSETMQVMGIATWLWTTKDGLLKEVHNDLNIRHIIDKYGRNVKDFPSSRYYLHYLDKIRSHPYLRVGQGEIDYLFYLIKHKKLLVDDRLLLIEDLGSFHQRTVFNEQKTLAISEIFTSLQDIYNSLLQEGQARSYPKTVSKLIQDTLDLLSQMMASLTQVLQTNYPLGVNRVTARVLVLDKEQVDALEQDLAALDRLVLQLRAFYQVFADFDYQFPFNRIKNWLKDFNGLKDQSGALAIIGDQFQEHFYQLKLSVGPTDVTDQMKQFCFAWSGVRLIDLYYADSFKAVFDLQSWLEDFEVVSYLSQPNTSVDIKIPIAYLFQDQSPEESEANGDLISHYHQVAISACANYIADEYLTLGSRILLLAPNKPSVEAVYQALVKADINLDYLILAEGLMGNKRKVNRKFLESDRSILILNIANSKHLNLPYTDQPVVTILLSLPFLSSQDWLGQIQARKFKWQKQALMDLYLIKKMQGRLVDIALMVDQAYPESDVYLLDDRVFTKYYSNRVRQFIKPYINLSIID